MNYRGDYEAYLYAVNKEIEAGERETAAARMSKAPTDLRKAQPAKPKTQRSEREVRKEMSNVEKAIARLDEQKKLVNTQYLAATNPQESLRLHNEVQSLTQQLAAEEDRWCALQSELSDESW